METLDLLWPMLRFASPLLLAALGGLLSERSGVVNIALEGFILWGAFAAAAVAYSCGNPWVGLAAGASLGGLAGLCYAWLVIGLRADQIVAGTAMNMLAWGGIPFAGKLFFDSIAGTPSLSLAQRLPSWSPIALAVVMLVLVYGFVNRSRLGLWLTFAGENPKALQAVGVRVALIRWFAVASSGVMAGLGGGVLAIALSSSYTRNMAAGRGFMALAALILGKWRALPTAGACLLLGFCELLQLKLQGYVFPGVGEIPVQLVQIIPYILTMIILAGFIGESKAPTALGSPLPR